MEESKITIRPFSKTPFSLFISILFIFITSSNSQSFLYTKHCNHIISQYPLTSFYKPNSQFLQLNKGYYKGGYKIFGQQSQNPNFDFSKLLFFSTYSVRNTVKQGVYQFEGSLYFHGIKKIESLTKGKRKLGELRTREFDQFKVRKKMESLIGGKRKFSKKIESLIGGRRKLGEFGSFGRRELSQFRVRGPRIPVRERGVSFKLHGYWDSGLGKACMVGPGISRSNEGNVVSHNVVFKLNYLNSSNIVSSLVNGVLESLDFDNSSLSYFEPVYVIGVSEMNYVYALIDKEMEKGSSFVGGGGETVLSLGLKGNRSFCGLMGNVVGTFELEYGSDCDDSVNCNPLGKGFGFLPSDLSLTVFQCSEEGGGKVRVLVKFSNSSRSEYRSLIPETTLIGEGKWDEKKNQLCLIACRILNFTDTLAHAYVGDCSIKLNLKFPAIMSLENRSTVVGEIWSSKSVNDSSYFGRLRFLSSWSRITFLSGLKYEYSKIDGLRNLCAKKKTTKKGLYPNGYSLDMNFDMWVKNKRGQRGWGYSSPLFVGNRLYEPRHASQMNTKNSSLLNISYRISITPRPTIKLGGETFSGNPIEISAEGTYDTETGILCMIGCRHLGLSTRKSINNDSTDCEILVTVQFPPLNSKGGDHVKGTIESKREKLDPFYFDRLELSSNSIYESVAAESIWRMDVEITLVLISHTFACLFVGWQLFYVKKYPDVLPFISIVMLIVITLGYMIPLLVNFEAFFVANRNRQNLFLDSNGWLEVNEVIVRVVTMIAFLLQCRLLQLTWSSRQDDGSQKGWWIAEKKVLYLSLPLYIFGGLIAWLAYLWKNYQNPLISRGHKLLQVFPYQQLSYRQQYSLWSHLKSYGGLVLDGFLLPQILFNLFSYSKERSLSIPFYIGTTFVRLLPHAYDLYRSHSSTNEPLSVPFVYANPRLDFYSTVWDVIIPCAGLTFAVLIYLQQRYGGRSILPKSFRGSSEYEKIPVVISE